MCSHPRKGEGNEEAAKRRLKEELGFETPLKLLFKFQYNAKFKDVGSEKEMCCVYIGKENEHFKIDKNEIAGLKYIELEELGKEILINSYLYTPWFIVEWERIQKYHTVDVKNL